MKKIILAYGALVIVLVLLAMTRAGGNLNISLPFVNKPYAEINNTKINLILAKSDKEKIKGLSGRKNLAQDTGMLFIFDKKDIYPFWMKDMNFALDIIYIDDQTVIDVIENAPPSKKDSPNLTIYKPASLANYVLEINSGVAKKLGIKKGTKITLKGI